MAHRQIKLATLDFALSALERNLLSATEHEMRDAQRSRRHALESRQVSEVIDAVLHGKEVKHSQPGSVKKMDLASRIEALRELVRTRPSASPRLSMVFGAGRTPSEQEVEDVTRELTRLGVLKTQDK
jgi:hypothetical protein